MTMSSRSPAAEDLGKSIDRASVLLKTPASHSDYLSLKIAQVSGRCCCLHCWPDTWAAVGERFAPGTPIEHEGDLLLGSGDDAVVLEGHESGPEIIAYLALATVSVALTTKVIDLVSFILKALRSEGGKRPGAVTLTTRRVTRDGNVEEEEEVAEVSLPIPDDMLAEIERRLASSVQRVSNDIASPEQGDDTRHNEEGDAESE